VNDEQTATADCRGPGDLLVQPGDGEVGKCPVCGVVKAVWIDRKAGVKLCRALLRERGKGG